LFLSLISFSFIAGRKQAYMVRIFILFISFLSLQPLMAQFYYPIKQDAADFQKRTLLVQLMEEDENILKKLKSKKTGTADGNEKLLAQYKLLIATHNDWIKEAFSKYWKASKAIDFKSKSEIEEILKDMKTLRQYAVLNVGWKNEYHFKDNVAQAQELFALVIYVAETQDRKLADLKRSATQKTDYLFKVAFPTDAINRSDYVLAVQQFNFHLAVAANEGQELERYRTLTHLTPAKKVGHEIVKQKIMLFPENVIDPEKKEEVKLAYEYPFELSGQNMVEEAVDRQFAKYVYVTMLWSDRFNGFAYFVVNASEGIILVELGRKPATVEFAHHSMEKNTSALDSDPIFSKQYYKASIGFSMDNVLQLQHVLGPKQ
jgi:hypothetical protein